MAAEPDAAMVSDKAAESTGQGASNPRDRSLETQSSGRQTRDSHYHCKHQKSAKDLAQSGTAELRVKKCVVGVPKCSSIKLTVSPFFRLALSSFALDPQF